MKGRTVILPLKICIDTSLKGALFENVPFLQIKSRVSSVYVDIKSYCKLSVGSLRVFPAGQKIGFISLHQLL